MGTRALSYSLSFAPPIIGPPLGAELPAAELVDVELPAAELHKRPPLNCPGCRQSCHALGRQSRPGYLLVVQQW
jgi:hypothetical protein